MQIISPQHLQGLFSGSANYNQNNAQLHIIIVNMKPMSRLSPDSLKNLFIFVFLLSRKLHICPSIWQTGCVASF